MARPKRTSVFKTSTPTTSIVEKITHLIPSVIPEASAEPETVFGHVETGIKTTWKPTEQEIFILTAMEKQKADELAQQNTKPIDTMLIFDDSLGKFVNLSPRMKAQIEAQDLRRAEQEQMSLDFKNKTLDDSLREFIDERLEIERTDPSVSTNLTEHVSTYGEQKFVNDYANNPQAIFKPKSLDTEQEMINAGLSQRIINMRVENDVVNKKETLVSTPNVNYSGIIDLPNMPTKVGVNGQHDNLFIPPEAENNNEVVTNQPVTQVNYTGSGSKGHQATDKETAHEVITTEKAGLAKLVHNNPMVLAIAGIGIMALGS